MKISTPVNAYTVDPVNCPACLSGTVEPSEPLIFVSTVE